MTLVFRYKYLGIWIDHNLKFDFCAKQLCCFSRYALGKLINKIKSSFVKLFESLVIPILEYGCEVWNLKTFKVIDDTQMTAYH